MDNWIDAMIVREATPKAAREDTIAEFCSKWGISDQTYYNHAAKDENQKKILKTILTSVKKKAPEILEKLGEKAESGDMKATDMYLNYVLELSKNLDLKSDGKPLPILNIKLNGTIQSDNSNGEDTETEQEN